MPYVILWLVGLPLALVVLFLLFSTLFPPA